MSGGEYQARFGEWLRAAREAAGMKQAELAAACGLAAGSISCYERGLTMPSAMNERRVRAFFAQREAAKGSAGKASAGQAEAVTEVGRS